MSNFTVLVIPAEPQNVPEVCSEPTQSTLPEWAEGWLQTNRAHCEPLGRELTVWWERNGVGTKNERALALWYAIHGSGAPVPPAFLGSVIVESCDGELPQGKLLSFFGNPDVQAFSYTGTTPPQQLIERLGRAWRKAS